MEEVQSIGSVRSLVLPLQHGAMLLPYSAVQEIISWRLPKEVDGAPVWLLGTVSWRRWRLPVISAEALLGEGFSQPARKAHIVVCSLLTGDDRLPCAGIVTRGVPQLVRADADNISPMLETEPRSVVSYMLRYRDTEAWIPDLAVLAGELAAVLT